MDSAGAPAGSATIEAVAIRRLRYGGAIDLAITIDDRIQVRRRTYRPGSGGVHR